MSFKDKVNILFLDVDSEKFCSKRPNGVQENACFVIDRAQLKHAEDWLMTDVGSFENRGSSSRVYTIIDGNIIDSKHVRGSKKKLLALREAEYLVRNVYYRHKKYVDFYRTVTTISDSTGEELQTAMIEYHFCGTEHSVSPHKKPRTEKPFIPTAPSTRKEILEKAKSHKGPSTIFDETVESTGGILHCDVMADMPRDVKQIKNSRQSLKEKENKDQFASLLDLSKQQSSVRNLQWTPSPRVVFCTDEQMSEIVQECCPSGSTSVLSIDTTYNIGEFYVTSTTYQSSKFINTRTKKPANLPGPAMFHVNRSEKDFKYFSHTLLEMNEHFEDVAFVGGDRDKAQQGFIKPLKRCKFLPCKKHVEDDISRKLTCLGLGDLKEEVSKDIFGDEKNKEKGIIDSTNDDEFLAKVISVSDKWDDLERMKYPGKEPEFAAYFRKYIEEDMKNGMLLPVRRSAGLHDGFFYNNAQECANFKYKSKIREAKMISSTGYRPSVKCTWTEAIIHYKNMVETVNRDKQRTVLAKGPYLLSPDYQHLQRSQLMWSKFSMEKKQAHLAKVDASCKQIGAIASDLQHNETEELSITTPPHPDIIGNFHESKLPEFLKGSWKNACKIVDQNGVGPFPNNENRRTVISLTTPTVHTVEIRSTGKRFVCDSNCARYKECAICAHTIAVAHKTGKLEEFVAAYEVPIGRMVQEKIPTGSGKKDNEKSMKRKRTEHARRDVSLYGERVEASSSKSSNNGSDCQYEVIFVKDTAATQCYGCKGRIREKPSSPAPQPPHDVFIRHLERRIFNRRGETKKIISKKLENVYYHTLKSCSSLSFKDVRDAKLVIGEDVKSNLSDCHKRMLSREFGMKF